MAGSQTVMTLGAVCFGVAVGFITYRTLVRTTDKTAITDLAAVLGAVGGGVVTGLFDPQASDLFGWYSIGLLAGMVVFFLAYWGMNGREQIAKVMSGETVDLTGARRERGGGRPQV